jgi:hypothetical protein
MLNTYWIMHSSLIFIDSQRVDAVVCIYLFIYFAGMHTGKQLLFSDKFVSSYISLLLDHCML